MRRLFSLVLTAGVIAAGAHLAGRVPEALAGIEHFRVRHVEVEGARHLSRADVVTSLSLPPGASVWDERGPWEDRVEAHPLVREARVRRRLPSTLVVEVEERAPVGLLAGPVVEPVDSEGRRLPIDPTGHRLDLPLLLAPPERGWPAVRLLAGESARLTEAVPSFASMLSELEWAGEGEVVARWGQPAVSIRFRAPVPVRRIHEAVRAFEDASARRPERRVLAVDLRWADQVFVRYASGGGS